MLRSLRRLAVCGVLVLVLGNSPVQADPIGWGWQQPGGTGSAVFLTYSYVNLFDGRFPTTLEPDQLRGATEMAMAIWARYAPIHFVEMRDAGPAPGDWSYDGRGLPQIRIGHHAYGFDGSIAHAFRPAERSWTEPGREGLFGDIHFSSVLPGGGVWGSGPDGPPIFDFFSVMLHELGHALGLDHIAGVPAVMGTIFTVVTDWARADLFAADIAAIRALYGAGTGSVQPLGESIDPIPEPGTFVLLAGGLLLLAAGRRRRSFARQ